MRSPWSPGFSAHLSSGLGHRYASSGDSGVRGSTHVCIGSQSRASVAREVYGDGADTTVSWVLTSTGTWAQTSRSGTDETWKMQHHYRRVGVLRIWKFRSLSQAPKFSAV